MSPITQQRLIGSILLLCVLAGIAFLLINSASDDVEIIPTTKPDIPFVSSINAIAPDDVEIVEAEQEVIVDAQAPNDVGFVQEIPEPITKKIETIAVETKITTTMWSLQLASLADKSAADALIKKVELLGYKAIAEKAETPKGDRFRVRIGPEQDKAALEATSKVLENKLNLKPLILKQLPE
ncbi:MAG: SPOR domain-containing protein [Methylophaga sp.]|nr:SPOR domain-containing protein [Methylophaga sp.]